MSYNVIALLKKKFAEKQVSDKFKTREFIVEIEDEKYPQFLTFQLTQAKCDLLDHVKEGQRIEVYFNLRGRMYTPKDGSGEKAFNSLEAWKIESKQLTQQEGSTSEFKGGNEIHKPKSEPYVSDPDSDLPF